MRKIDNSMAVIFCAALLTACGGGGGNAPAPSAEATAVLAESLSQPTEKAVAVPHPARLLASGCFNCHGTNGYSSGGFETLAGKSASEIYSELKEMAKPDETSIMRPHAANYSDTQMLQIADFFSRQKR